MEKLERLETKQKINKSSRSEKNKKRYEDNQALLGKMPLVTKVPKSVKLLREAKMRQIQAEIKRENAILNEDDHVPKQQREQLPQLKPTPIHETFCQMKIVSFGSNFSNFD